eukprot:5548532-Prymnesium_polylepis.1
MERQVDGERSAVEQRLRRRAGLDAAEHVAARDKALRPHVDGEPEQLRGEDGREHDADGDDAHRVGDDERQHVRREDAAAMVHHLLRGRRRAPRG